MPASAPIDTQPTALPAIVIIGKESGDRPRGSWFAREDAQAAKKAAQLSGLRTVSVRSGTVRELALRVPKGRIFSSGKAFTPLIQPSVYEGLLPHSAAAEPTSALRVVASGGGDAAADKKAGAATTAKTTEKLPPDWAHIGNGCTVLAYSPEDEAWFDCVVTETKADGIFVLRWRDYPDEPVFQRRRYQLALKFPEGNAATA